MDTITQGLLGAVTAQLGFRQRIGTGATWVAAVAAVIPDLDILVHPILSLTGAEPGDFTRIVMHRGISHSLLLVPLIALPIAFLWRWFKRKLTKNNGNYLPPKRNPQLLIDEYLISRLPTEQIKKSCVAKPLSFLGLYACVFVATLSHPLLDWCTSYGTQLFAPITNKRYALDAVPIVDIIYSSVLILTLLVCYSVRKIARHERRASLIVGWLGFFISVGYITAGYTLKNVAAERMRKSLQMSDLANGMAPAKFHAYPQLGTIFVWRVTRQGPDSWMAARVHVLSKQKPHQLVPAKAPIRRNRWVRQARRLPDVKMFEWFAMYQTRADYRHEKNLRIVEFHDMRYGWPADSLQSLWSVRVTFADSGELLDICHMHHYPHRSVKQLVQQAWEDIWNF